MARSALLNVMVQAVRKAGRGLSRDFGEVENLQVSMKGPGDFVSAADKRSEQVLFEELKRVRPTYGFLMEERGEVAGEDEQHRWVVDPLDGTANFLHSIPIFSISLSLERNGVPHLGRGNHPRYLNELRQVMANCAGIRRLGSAALDLCYVAAGKLDGFWEDDLNPWDTSAGWLMIKEAGGFVTDKNGKDDMHASRTLVAGNEAIHAQLLATLKKA